MTFYKNIALVALVTLLAASIQTEAADPVDVEVATLRLSNWTSCDITSDPILSCANCKTRLICKPIIGGLLLGCLSPYRPYCVKGICSPIPTEECANEENSTTQGTSTTEEIISPP